MTVDQIIDYWTGKNFKMVSEDNKSFVWKTCSGQYGLAMIDWDEEEVHFVSYEHDLTVPFSEIKGDK